MTLNELVQAVNDAQYADNWNNSSFAYYVQCNTVSTELTDLFVQLVDSENEFTWPSGWGCGQELMCCALGEYISKVLDTHQVTRNGEFKFKGSEAICYHWLLNNQSQSTSRAIKHEGWKVEVIK